MTTGSHPAPPISQMPDSAGEVLVGLGQSSWPRFIHKRVFDIVLVSLSGLFILPLLVLIAVAIRLSSPGPVFFRQARMGAVLTTRNGRPQWELRVFQIYKFRSMYQDADQSLHRAQIKAFAHNKLKGEPANSTRFKIQEDPRITPVGRFLRRTSLDELPQLFNVLKGEMSLVGPRPVPLYEVAEYEQDHFERLAALPGLTGLWQVEGRGRVTFDEMMKMDIAYVRQQNLGLDIMLLLRTIPVVLTGRGAR